MTDTIHPTPGPQDATQRLSALAALFGADGPPDLDDISGPFHWGALTPSEALVAWPELRSWVEQLIAASLTSTTT